MNKQPQNKPHYKAPLPFTGQKRNFLKAYKQLLETHISGDGSGWTIVDVFGGSGLLSHITKRHKPSARVIYNDFDGYANRLAHIADTNRLRLLLIGVLADTPKHKHIDKNTRQRVIDVIKGFDGYVDLVCLCSWLLFSGSQASSLDELFKKHMYNCMRRSDYPDATGYLDGLEIVSQSYTDLLPVYENCKNTLLVLDPPYLNTQQKSYALDNYFGMVDFLQIMHHIRPPYIFFSSTRSELLSYMEFVRQYQSDNWQRFGDYKKITIKATLNHNANYEDHLIYRFKL